VATEITERLQAPVALTTLALCFGISAFLVGRSFPELRKEDSFNAPTSAG
jgi:hypothetical protein